MKAFNINIDHRGKELTLTIIPFEDYYKIVYFGGILGAVKQVGSGWILLTQEQIDPGQFAPYDYKLTPEGEDISLGIDEINQIAGAIENHLK